MIENAPRDRARCRRAIALRKSYRETGDRRKLKRAKRLERQIYRSQMRIMNRSIRSVSEVLQESAVQVKRFVDSIADAFAKIRTNSA